MVAFGSCKESIIEDMNVTSPLLPDMKEFHSLLEEIWSNEWVTNNGIMHQRLEKALTEYLHVPALSIFTNGTMPLVTALERAIADKTSAIMAVHVYGIDRVIEAIKANIKVR